MSRNEKALLKGFREIDSSLKRSVAMLETHNRLAAIDSTIDVIDSLEKVLHYEEKEGFSLKRLFKSKGIFSGKGVSPHLAMLKHNLEMFINNFRAYTLVDKTKSRDAAQEKNRLEVKMLDAFEQFTEELNALEKKLQEEQEFFTFLNECSRKFTDASKGRTLLKFIEQLRRSKDPFGNKNYSNTAMAADISELFNHSRQAFAELAEQANQALTVLRKVIYDDKSSVNKMRKQLELIGTKKSSMSGKQEMQRVIDGILQETHDLGMNIYSAVHSYNSVIAGTEAALARIKNAEANLRKYHIFLLKAFKNQKALEAKFAQGKTKAA